MDKYREINPEKNTKKSISKHIIEGETTRARAVSMKTNFMRPSIRQSKNDVHTNVILRDMDLIEDKI